MAIDVKPICDKSGDCVLQMEQTIDTVMDVKPIQEAKGPPPTHELVCDTSKSYHDDDHCFPADHLNGQDWTLSQIFGLPDSRVVYASEGSTEIKDKNGTSRCYTIPPQSEFALVLPKSEAKTPEEAAKELVEPVQPLLYAERSFTGHGQEHGGVQAILTNPNTVEVEFVYLESLPWFMRIYLHTLSTRISSSAAPTTNSSELIKQIHYRPALDRSRGTQLELLMRIPPRCTVFLTYDFEKAILRYTEYPPDANRGFDVAAAVIRTLEPQL
ncbi:Subunit of the glycosylphosphatidylinositol transamidase complex-like protein [Metarhizium acridum]|nr:Subunit of the glycosylphosphatidylinositol transamidase complex-like protein [Metarhizium acridum]